MKLTTITDAKTFVNNSGVLEWEWGGDASCGGFARFLWRNYGEVDADDYDSELTAYLASVGEDPADYL